MTMTLLALGDNATGGGVQGGEKGGRAVADVVVRISLNVPETQGQGRLQSTSSHQNKNLLNRGWVTIA